MECPNCDSGVTSVRIMDAFKGLGEKELGKIFAGEGIFFNTKCSGEHEGNGHGSIFNGQWMGDV